MASISKEKRSGKYRVLIRKRGLPTISRTFTLKGNAVKWARDIEGDRERHIAEGNTVARSMTLSALLDEYISHNGRGGTIQRYQGLHGGVKNMGISSLVKWTKSQSVKEWLN